MPSEEFIVEKSWKDAISRVLAESDSPLHYTEISEIVLSRGYYHSEGATPTATVSAQLSQSIKQDGEKSPFIRIAKGIYSLRNKDIPNDVTDILPESDEDTSDSIIHSFGMYWKRDDVLWNNNPNMYGKQLATSKAVDFGKQKGIYILYDHHTAVYVGRSVDRPLGRRLYEHTIDRLSSRWDRFSWFGLLDVTQDGNLREITLKTSLASSLVATLEALLIETLEPPQNRKRGDDFTAIEYIQEVDPEIKKIELKKTIQQMLDKA